LRQDAGGDRFVVSALVVLALVGALQALSSKDEPSRGKVRVFVLADSAGVEGLPQTARAELHQSARELQKRIKGLKWLALAESEESAELVLRILARHEDPYRGYVVRYRLDASEFRTEDEFVSAGEPESVGGGGPVSVSGRSRFEGRRSSAWGELAKGLARWLDRFAESNYERLKPEPPG
jgi:hypothetical protein